MRQFHVGQIKRVSLRLIGLNMNTINDILIVKPAAIVAYLFVIQAECLLFIAF